MLWEILNRLRPHDVIHWSNKYRTGFRAIDKDHRQLFRLVNKLHAAVKRNDGPRVIGGTFAALNDYIEAHFEREEKFLAQAEYPDLADHQFDHIELCWKVRELERLFLKSPDTFDFDDFLQFMGHWLTNHILERDFAYASYLRGEM